MASQQATEARIRERIMDAIYGCRLEPGARLTEEALADLFGVSRTIVRQALARLAQDGIVVHRPNRGTQVATPTRKDAQQTFAVRRMVEPEIVSLLAQRSDAALVRRLERHLDTENKARETGADTRLLRLTGRFHMMLAEATGFPVLARLVAELQAFTCLSVMLYSRSADDASPPCEHEAIVAAIAGGEAERAAELMRHHLTHVEARLNLSAPVDEVDTLAKALGMPPAGALAMRR